MQEFPHLKAAAWVRLDTPPRRRVTPTGMWQLAFEMLPSMLQRVLSFQSRALILVRFPDEVGWRRPGEATVALIRDRGETPTPTALSSQGASEMDPVGVAAGTTPSLPSSSSRMPRVSCVRVQSLARDDLTSRAPQAAALRGKEVVVAGLGALGGPAALELARAGVGTLVLFDEDLHLAENTIRQLPDLFCTGLPKALVLERMLRYRLPETAVTGLTVRLGAHAPDLHDDLLRLLARADAVCDLTANLAVTRFLSAHCREAGTPFVVGSGTYGGWGGTVIALVPDPRRACWQCVELHRRDGLLPSPPQEEPRHRPVGCGDAFFTGAAYTLAPVWQHTVSVTVGELLRDEQPHLAFDADAFTLASRDSRGHVRTPTWRQQTLPIHPGCPRHPPTSADPTAVESAVLGGGQRVRARRPDAAPARGRGSGRAATGRP
jgi:hypothetical protein